MVQPRKPLCVIQIPIALFQTAGHSKYLMFHLLVGSTRSLKMVWISVDNNPIQLLNNLWKKAVEQIIKHFKHHNQYILALTSGVKFYSTSLYLFRFCWCFFHHRAVVDIPCLYVNEVSNIIWLRLQFIFPKPTQALFPAVWPV